MSVTDSWVQWCWTIFSYSTSIMNQMVNPVLFLTMNKMVRAVLRNFFRPDIEQPSERLNTQKSQRRLKTGVLRKVSRLFVKSKRIVTNNHPSTRNTWVC